MATVPISDGDPKNTYTASSGQTIFAYTFWVRDEDHIAVYVNGTLKTIVTDYTVSAVKSVTGANVVFNTGVDEDDVVVIVYDPLFERTAEYTGTIRLDALNEELTYMLTLLQSNQRKVDDALRTSETETVTFNPELPALTGNGSKVLRLASDAGSIEYATIGDSTAIGNFESLVTDGDNSTVTFALGFTPSSNSSLLVEVDGVILEPTVDYTFSGTNITFTSAPSSGTDNIVIRNLASGIAATTPADGSVTTAKLATNAVTSVKITDANITTNKMADNSVTLAKMEHGTQGDILYYGASGAPTRLGFGTSGQVLQTNGSGANPSWGTVASFGSSDITGQTNATIAAADQIVFSDADDSGNLKEDTVQGIIDLVDVSPTLGTPQATTSGTTKDFSIPAGTKKITINFDQVSLSGTDHLLVQLGDSGGFETTGYLASTAFIVSSSVGSVASTSGFPIYSGSASVSLNGSITLSLLDNTNHIWAAQGNFFRDNSGACINCGGSKTLSAALEDIRITTNGSNTFDAGSVNILYE